MDTEGVDDALIEDVLSVDDFRLPLHLFDSVSQHYERSPEHDPGAEERGTVHEDDN